MDSKSSTDKVVLSSHGLELRKLSLEHVKQFVDNLSDENMREFAVVYKRDPLVSLIEILNDQMAFAILRGDKVLCVTGVEDNCMWALFSRDMKNSWVRFARASPDLIRFYHHFYEVLYCDVWSENEMIHQWLAYLGFEATTIVKTSTEQDLVRFVHCKKKSSKVYKNRPVMH